MRDYDRNMDNEHSATTLHGDILIFDTEQQQNCRTGREVDSELCSI